MEIPSIMRGGSAVFLLVLLVSWMPTFNASGKTIYVNASALGTAEGSSWAEAFPFLQDALEAAESGDEIWVARGTYHPDEGQGQTSGDRLASFRLASGVALYGGFAGDEADRSQRDIAANPTILSGEIGNPAKSNDNSCHVLIGEHLDSSAVLDGFTVTAGIASIYGQPYFGTEGGAMFLTASSPALSNCSFVENLASSRGGAIYMGEKSSPVINDCAFVKNGAWDGGGAVSCEDSSPRFQRCSFRNNHSNGYLSGSGGAVDLSSSGISPAFADCFFSGNQAKKRGGAMIVFSCSPRILRCVFLENQAPKGGAICMDGSYTLLPSTFPEFLDCTLRANSSGFGGGIHSTKSSPSFVNCVISGNNSDYDGGAIYNVSSNSSFLNCTVTGNAAKRSAAAFYNGAEEASQTPPTPMFSNTILWNNGTGETTAVSGAPASYSHCLVEGSGGSAEWDSSLGEDLGGNLDADPLFLTPADPADAPSEEGECFLNSASPAVDAGKNTANAEPTDIDGRPRIIGPAIDLGAREMDPTQFIFSKNTPLEITLLSDPDLVYADLPDLSAYCNLAITRVTLLSNEHPDILEVDIATDQSVNLSPTGVPGISKLEFEIASASLATTYSLDVRLVRPVIFVNENTPPGGDGISWASAFASLQDALAIARETTRAPFQAVWVARGTYHPDQGAGQTAGDRLASFRIAPGVRIYGGFSGSETEWSQRDISANPTTLSGEIGDPAKSTDNSCHVLLGENLGSSAVLDGFAVTGGYANMRGSSDLDGIRNSVGGALLLIAASPAISNCLFTENTASYFGGAFYLDHSAPLVTNCTFWRNHGYRGGGAVNNRYSQPAFINCTFHGNDSSGRYASGGAISNDYSTSTLTNCIVWHNTARSWPSLYGLGNCSHCLIEGFDPDGSCLDGTDPAHAPLFASPSTGDFRLLVGSPAIDAGDNTANPLAFDIAGAPRIQNNIIDLGALEGGLAPVFSLLFPGLDPDGDENGDGQSNYHDYASGADPLTPDTPENSLAIKGKQLVVPRRANASDVFILLEKSSSMNPGSWTQMTEDLDYRILSSTTIAGQTRLFLEILDPPTAARFFRVQYHSRQPGKPRLPAPLHPGN